MQSIHPLISLSISSINLGGKYRYLIFARTNMCNCHVWFYFNLKLDPKPGTGWILHPTSVWHLELFYSFVETMYAIIHPNSRCCCLYCWLPVEKVAAGPLDVHWCVKQLKKQNNTEIRNDSKTGEQNQPCSVKFDCLLNGIISNLQHKMKQHR